MEMGSSHAAGKILVPGLTISCPLVGDFGWLWSLEFWKLTVEKNLPLPTGNIYLLLLFCSQGEPVTHEPYFDAGINLCHGGLDGEAQTPGYIFYF